MPISRRRSYTAPSIALSTMSAATSAGIASAPSPFTAVSPTELRAITSPAGEPTNKVAATRVR